MPLVRTGSAICHFFAREMSFSCKTSSGDAPDHVIVIPNRSAKGGRERDLTSVCSCDVVCRRRKSRRVGQPALVSVRTVWAIGSSKDSSSRRRKAPFMSTWTCNSECLGSKQALQEAVPLLSPVLGRVGIPRTNPLSAVASSKPAHPFAENAKGWGTPALFELIRSKVCIRARL